MNCRRCGATWKLGNTSSRIDCCPVCDDDYQKKPENRVFDTITELIHYLILKNGVDFWNNDRAINGYLNDYFPDKVETREAIKKLFGNGIGKKMQEWYDDVPQEDTISQEIILSGINKHINEFVSDIMFLLEKDNIKGTNFEEHSYYEEFAENCHDEKYVVMALEKALFYGASDDAALKLSDIELKSDKDKGVDRLKSLAQKGNLNAILKMAKLCEDGIYVKKNYAEEIEYLNKAEQMESPEGMYQLGRLYMLGWGVDKNRQRATDLFEKSAKDSHPKANYQLYSIYYSSDRNLKQEAMNKLQISAKAGYEPAMYEYALHLLYGENIAENIPMAISMLEMCANGGNKEAIEKLSYLYSVGYKVEKDKLKALQWEDKN